LVKFGDIPWPEEGAREASAGGQRWQLTRGGRHLARRPDGQGGWTDDDLRAGNEVIAIAVFRLALYLRPFR